MKRNLTPNEEQAIRLIHHDFGGVSIEDAAIYMDRTVRAVQRLLHSAEKKAPQMFPILTPEHRAILAMHDQDISREAMAVGLGITEDQLEARIAFLREHKFLRNKPVVAAYKESMDAHVVEKF